MLLLHMKDSSKSVGTRAGFGSVTGSGSSPDALCAPWYPRFDRAGYDGREGDKR